MKTISKLQLVALGVGATLSSFSVISAPTLATTIQVGSNTSCSATATGNDLLINFGSNETVFNTGCGISPIGIVQGRTGKQGGGNTPNGDYEVGFNYNGANVFNGVQPDTLQLIWENKTTYNWILDWDKTDPNANKGGTGRFVIYKGNTPPPLFNYDGSDGPVFKNKNDQVVYHQFIGNLDTFNAFGLIVQADPSLKNTNNQIINLNAKTTLTLNSVTLDGNQTQSLSGISILAESGVKQFDKQFFTINPNQGTEITQLKGNFMVDFGSYPNLQTINGQGAKGIGFQIKLLDPPITNVSVPEPGVMLGLFSLGLFGTLKKRQKSN